MSKVVIAPVLPTERRNLRRTQIEEILARGNVVKFYNPFREQQKFVDQWNEDEDGDLKAFRATRNCDTHYVCWDSERYDISEVTREEVPPE